MNERIEASQQFLDTYFSGKADLFKAITSIVRTGQTVHNDKQAYQDLVFNEWLKYLNEVLEKTGGQFPSLIERFWWSVAFEPAGLSFNDIVMNSYLHILAEHHLEQLKDGFKQAKREGAIPSNIKNIAHNGEILETALQAYIRLRFSPPKTRLYTNDSVFQVLGVKSEQDLAALSKAEFTFKLAKMITDGTFSKLHNATFHDYQRDYDSKESKNDCKIDEIKLQRLYSERRKPSHNKNKRSIDAQLEDSGIIHKGYVERDDQGNIAFWDAIDQPSTLEDRIEYLSDSDRLSQFCELAGIEMDKLTYGEANRLIDLLHAPDPNIGGYELASKTGISLAAYYGDKANSEKTQRQRLFKKIKEVSDKPK